MGVGAQYGGFGAALGRAGAHAAPVRKESFVVTLSWLLLIGLIGAVLALIDGIIRVRGRGTAILAVVEIIAAALFILSFFVPVPFGSLVLAIVTLILLILQLVLRGSTRRSGVGLTVVAIVLIVIWIVLAQHWIIIPGIN
jgi:hypothetical protein